MKTLSFMQSTTEKKPNCFIVLFEARSGSTFLAEALNSHSKIRSEKELLSTLREQFERGKATPEKQQECISKLYVAGDHDYDVIGFKTKIKDILDREKLAAVLRENHASVILLQRKNRIKLLVSLLNAMKLNDATGEWNLYDESDRQGVMRLDPEQFNEWLIKVEESNRDLQDYAKSLNLPILEVYYEEILCDAEVSFRRICEFLGVDYEPLEGGTKKHTSDDLREVLKNFDELASSFENTHYQEMFFEVLMPSVS